jgi:ribulose-5-phosphate 4-epimerase/fuculose-1-phosphate aldolase
MSNLLLENLCALADSFFARGYAFGSTGNLSVRSGDSVWITPTGKPLAGLTPEKLAEIDFDGKPLHDRAKPSKEYPFHLACYKNHGPECQAIVHLHSTYTVALSCLEEIDAEQTLPAITPYYFMRVQPMAVVPYCRPGSEELGKAVGQAAAGHKTLLLRNHGSICLGKTLNEAADRAEELEETAKLHFLLRGERLRTLTPEEIADLRKTFG